MIVLKTTQDRLLAALQSVSGIVERRHTLPVLANVLIRKAGEATQLTTSDLEIQIRTAAELGGDAAGFSTTVGARKLIDILRTMPADQVVSLESQQSKLILKGGSIPICFTGVSQSFAMRDAFGHTCQAPSTASRKPMV